MHFKLIYPKSGHWWVPTLSAGILTTPQNKDFDPEHIIARLEELKVGGHTYEVIDGDALSPEERRRIYFQEAVPAAGNRYAIRQTYGSRKNVGTENVGTNIPVLIVFDNGGPVDVFPHQLEDGSSRTIRDYIDGL